MSAGGARFLDIKKTSGLECFLDIKKTSGLECFLDIKKTSDLSSFGVKKNKRPFIFRGEKKQAARYSAVTDISSREDFILYRIKFSLQGMSKIQKIQIVFIHWKNT